MQVSFERLFLRAWATTLADRWLTCHLQYRRIDGSKHVAMR
jgi:hypothetical protein